ncbi:hypothetical protein BX616_008007, partial [Lobosporangium transversale]
ALGLSYNTDLHSGIEMRRTSHKAAEQKRRDSLKHCFDDLRQMIPNIVDKAPSKVFLLKKSFDYICSLKLEIAQRDLLLARQEAQQDHFKKSMEEWISSTLSLVNTEDENSSGRPPSMLPKPDFDSWKLSEEELDTKTVKQIEAVKMATEMAEHSAEAVEAARAGNQQGGSKDKDSKSTNNNTNAYINNNNNNSNSKSNGSNSTLNGDSNRGINTGNGDGVQSSAARTGSSEDDGADPTTSPTITVATTAENTSFTASEPSISQQHRHSTNGVCYNSDNNDKNNKDVHMSPAGEGPEVEEGMTMAATTSTCNVTGLKSGEVHRIRSGSIKSKDQSSGENGEDCDEDKSDEEEEYDEEEYDEEEEDDDDDDQEMTDVTTGQSA